jgi:Cytochrome C'
MKRVYGLVAISMFFVSCTQAQAPGSAPAAATAAKPYGTLAQMMRGIPFPNSNIIFDTQTTDPAVAQKPPEAGAPASVTFGGVYGGWQAVENAALALEETANLLAIPGRMCENGKPAPIDQEDFKKWTQGLADAGAAAYKAAQSKNIDQMVEVSGTVADACAACHEKYRDTEDLTMRCIP